nr:hypothetical protein [Candidatus Sigynarchaeota archaeon]
YTTSFTLRRCEAFVDGISSYNDTWSNSSTEMVFVNGLAIGTHGVVFRFHDGIGGMTEGNASVTVFNVVPVLTRWIDSNLTVDVTYVRDEGVFVTLESIRIVDSSVDSPTYTVLVNGTSNATGTWQSGMNFSIAIGIFPPGNYNLTIVFDDGLGGTATRHVYITWQAASPPPDYSGVMLVVIIGGIAAAVVVSVIKVSSIRKNKARAHDAAKTAKEQDKFDMDYLA